MNIRDIIIERYKDKYDKATMRALRDPTQFDTAVGDDGKPLPALDVDGKPITPQDYLDQARVAMGWSNKQMPWNRRAQGISAKKSNNEKGDKGGGHALGFDFDSLYVRDDASPMIPNPERTEILDNFKKQAESRGFEPEAQFWNAGGLKWDLGITLPNSRHLRVTLNKKGEVNTIDITKNSSKTEKSQKDTEKTLNKLLGKKYKVIDNLNYQYRLGDKNFSITDYWQIVDILSPKIESDNLDFNFVPSESTTDTISSGSSSGGPKTSATRRVQGKFVSDPRFFYNMARSLVTVYQSSKSEQVKRGAGNMDLQDWGIFYGFSPEGKRLIDARTKDPNAEKPYREHAVPCDLLSNAAFDMYENWVKRNNELERKADADWAAKTAKDPSLTLKDRVMPKLEDERDIIDAIAKMLKRNLILILISTAEAKELDKKYQTRMPSPNWDPQTGDQLERFKVVGIPVISKDGTRRIAEIDNDLNEELNRIIALSRQ